MQIINKLLAIILFSCALYESVADKNLPNTFWKESKTFPSLITESKQREKSPPITITKPNIVSREAWGAKDPVGEMKRHAPSRITVHHTASPQKRRATLEEKMRNLQAFSQSRGTLAGGRPKLAWPDVPYHFYIGVDGRIAEARDINFVGDTNTDYDPSGHVLVVLEGNFEKERPSAQQIQALNELSLWLADTWKIPASNINGHKDFAATACPGKNLESELPRLRKNIAGATRESD